MVYRCSGGVQVHWSTGSGVCSVVTGSGVQVQWWCTGAVEYRQWCILSGHRQWCTRRLTGLQAEVYRCSRVRELSQALDGGQNLGRRR